MSVDHLDTLHEQLPELFQPRDLAPGWDDGIIIVPIDDPEWVSDVAEVNDNQVLSPTGDDFPNIETLAADWLEPGSPVPELSPIIVDTLGGAHSGAPIPYTQQPLSPPPDCLAFYLPFHYYHPNWWGVYLLFEGVLWLAGEIIKRSGGTVRPTQAMQAARLFLYYHEAFHHRTECFATRLEVSHRRPFYKTGFERLYQQTLGTDQCLEEGLANATALDDSKLRLKSDPVDRALVEYVKNSPPGYKQGHRLRRSKFLPNRCAFAENNQHICLPHLPAKDPEVWRSSSYMFTGIANIKSRVNYVIPRSSPLVNRLPFRLMLPPSKLIRKLQDLIGLVFVRHGGAHDIYKTGTGKQVPIPRHQRDLGRGLVRKILREAGLDMGLEEFLEQ